MHLLLQARSAHCPTLPPDCAAIARNQYAVWGCLQAGHRTHLWSTGTTPPAIRRPGHCARQNPPRPIYRKFVPGTDQLAVIAAVYAVADQGAQSFGDAPLMLDRKVRNAAPRIQPIWCDNRMGRANINTLRAASAIVADRCIHSYGHIGIYFAQKEHGASLTRKQQCMLAAPAKP